MSGTRGRPHERRRRARRSPLRTALRALLVSVAAGGVVGLVWWLSDLGGVRGRGDGYLALVQSVGAADAGFALGCLLSGALAGMWWIASREHEHDARGVARLVGLLVGGLLGGTLAWLVGAGLADAFPAAVQGVPADTAAELLQPTFSLAVVASVLLWPVGVGVLVLVDTLRELAWRAVSPGPATP